VTIYADTYAALNFGVNYLILLSTAHVCGAIYKKRRLALGALVGAAYALVCGWVPLLERLPFKLGAAVLIVWTALGRGHLVKRSILFLGASFALGGAVWAIYIMTGKREVSPAAIMLCAALCCAVMNAAFRLTGAPCGGGRLRLEITRQGRCITVNALVDTGNLLTCPRGNLPVIVCENAAVMPLLSQAEQRAVIPDDPLKTFENLQKLGANPRLLPYHTVSAGTELMVALRPDAVQWQGGQSVSVLLALCPGQLSPGGEYTAVTGSWIWEQGGNECVSL